MHLVGVSDGGATLMAIRGSLAWMAFGQGSLFLLQFVGSIFIARLLGPLDMGVFAIAMSMVGLIGVIQAVGLGSFLIRERDLTPDVVASASTVNAVICVLMSLTIAGLALVGGEIFDNDGVREVLLVIAIVPIIGQLAFVPQAMIEREGNFRVLALVKATSSAVGVAVTVLLATWGYRYMSLAYSQVLTAVLTNIALNIIGRRHANWRFSLTHLPRIARFGAHILAISGLTRVASRSMELVLGRVQGLAALGLYSRASSNHAMLWDSVHGVVGAVIFVDFARHVRDGIALRHRYLRVLSVMTGLMWPMLAGVAVLSGPLVSLLYGPAWLGAATPLALLCMASILLVSTTMTWELFVVFEETGRQVRLEFWRTLIGTSLFVACCFHSLEAAAAARVAEAVVAQFIYRPHLERMTGATRRDFGAVYLRSGTAAAAAIAPALVLMAIWRFSTQVPVEQVVIATLLGMALWLVAIRALRHPLFDEIQTLVRRFKPLGAAAP